MDDGLDPPVHIRIVLEESRSRRLDFDTAWDMAMKSLPRGNEENKHFWAEWRTTLHWARPYYEAAFHRWVIKQNEVYVIVEDIE